MAASNYDTTWYCNYGNGTSTGYYAVTKWATGTLVAVGALVRQKAAPAVGNERVFVCTTAGTTHATTEPTWGITRGGWLSVSDNGVAWNECTGQPAMNGDITNTLSWTNVKQLWPVIGTVITNVARTYLFFLGNVTSAGIASSEPSWNLTPGAVTTDGGCPWYCIGSVASLAYSAFGAPHARLANVFASGWAAAGAQVFVGSNHVETQTTAMTIAPTGTLASPNYIYCVSSSVAPPTALTTGASITTTSNANITVVNNGSAANAVYFNGITINISANGILLFGNGNYGHSAVLENCVLGMGSGSTLRFNNASSYGGGIYRLKNTQFSFGATSNSISVQSAGRFIWENTPLAILGSIPTTLFNAFYCGSAIIDGVDLSAITTGNTLVGAGSVGGTGNCLFNNCKIASGVTIAGTPAVRGNIVSAVRCDSAGTTYQQQKFMYEGTLVPETTIVRSGGATDGVTPISWNITSNANALMEFPFESPPIAAWNTATGSPVNVTIYGIWNGSAGMLLPNNSQIWIEVDYMGSSLTPINSIGNNGVANQLVLASTVASQSSDSSTWGGSLPNAVPFAMTFAVTPALAGPIYVKIKATGANTYYIDPQVYLH